MDEDTEGTLGNSEATSPFRFPDGSLKFIAGGADDDDENDDEKTDDGTDDSEDVTDSEDENDDIAQAVKAALDAEKERIRQELAEDFRKQREQEEEEETARREREDNESKLTNSFGDTVKEIRNNIKTIKIRDADNQIVDVTLDDNFLEETVFKPLQKYNQSGTEAQKVQVRRDLMKAASETIAEADRKDFRKRVANKEFDEVLKIHGETYAPSSDWAKNLIRKHEADLKAATEAAEARGFRKGQKAPPGSTTPGQTGATKGKVDLTTAGGLARALNNGDITNEKFVELWGKVTGKI